MTIKTDFHLHTNLSVDAEATVDQIVQNSINAGMTEIAITDHLDHNPADPGTGRYDPRQGLRQTLDAREKYKSQISIRTGIELSEPHLYADKNQHVYELNPDVIIGSIHYAGPYGVHSDLFTKLEKHQAISQYFQAMTDTARDGDFDVLGHLDYFDRYSASNPAHGYNPEDYRDRIEKILALIIERRIALEINTSGYRNPPGRLFPHQAVLKWYHKMGGKLLSIGSDAHSPEHVGLAFEKTSQILKNTGFSQYHIYHNRTPIPKNL